MPPNPNENPKLFENSERMCDPKKFARDYHEIKNPTQEEHLHYAEALYHTDQFSECSRFINSKINSFDGFALLYLKNILGRSENVQNKFFGAIALFEHIIKNSLAALEEGTKASDEQKVNYRRLIARTYADYVDTCTFQQSIFHEKSKSCIKECIKYLNTLEDDDFKIINSLGICQHDASLMKANAESKATDVNQNPNFYRYSENVLAKLDDRKLFHYKDALKLFHIIDIKKQQGINHNNEEEFCRYVDHALKSYQHIFRGNETAIDDVVHLDIAQLYNARHHVVIKRLNRSNGKTEYKDLLNESLALAEKCVWIYESIVGTNSIYGSVAYNNLGKALYRMQRLPEALKYYLIAISIKKSILHDIHSLDLSHQYLNLGECYFSLKRNNESLHYIDLTISILKLQQTAGNNSKVDDLIKAYFVKAMIYIKQSDKAAEAILINGYEILDTDMTQVSSLYNLVRGHLQRADGDYEEADKYYGLAMGDAGNNFTLRESIRSAQARLVVLRARKSWGNRELSKANSYYSAAEETYEQVLKDFCLPPNVGEYRIGKTYLEHSRIFLDPDKSSERERLLDRAKKFLSLAGNYSNGEMHLIEVYARINAESNKNILQQYHWNLTSHYHYAQFSNYAYEDIPNMSNRHGNWHLMTNARQTKLNRRTFWAQAFKSVDRREIVIAYRGTQFKLGSVKTDLQLYQAELDYQFSYAVLFFSCVLNEYLTSDHDGTFYDFRFTGHSLGGALALYTLYVALYRPDLNKLKIPSALRQKLYAVVFDAAGIADLLEEVEQATLLPERTLEMKKRVINYVANPHIVNAAMGQVGQLIRIHFPDNDGVVQIGYSVFSVAWAARINPRVRSFYRFATQHPLLRLMSAFDSNTGRLALDRNPASLIQSWPHGLHELHQYIILAQEIVDEDFKLNSSAEVRASLENLAQNKTHYVGSTFSMEGIQYISKDQLDLSVWMKLDAILDEHAKNYGKMELDHLTTDPKELEEIFFVLTSYFEKNDRLCSIILPASSLVIVANRIAHNRMMKENASRRDAPQSSAVSSTRDLTLYHNVHRKTDAPNGSGKAPRSNQITPMSNSGFN